MAEAEALWAVVGFIMLTSIVMPGGHRGRGDAVARSPAPCSAE
jgi:hypothetical protein